MKANLMCLYPVVTTGNHGGPLFSKGYVVSRYVFLIINTMASSEVHVHTHLGTDKSTP